MNGDGNRNKCALCRSTDNIGITRSLSTMCWTCGVRLFVTPVVNMVCYEEWHTATNFNMSHNDAQKCLKVMRDKKNDSCWAIASITVCAKGTSARTANAKKRKNTSCCDTEESSGLLSRLSVLATCASKEGQQKGVEASINNTLQEGSDSDIIVYQIKAV